MKTYCKYLMGQAIQAGCRQPRSNYNHTAKNSAKRDPNGLRGPKYGKAALRTAQESKVSDITVNLGPPAGLDPSPPFGEVVDYLDPQPHLEPAAGSSLAIPPNHPRAIHPYSTIEPLIYSRYPQPHAAAGRWDGQSSFSNVNQARYNQYQLPHPHPEPLAGPSQQGIRNPASMENMYQFKLDRTPSPFPHTNHASGSNTRYDPRCD